MEEWRNIDGYENYQVSNMGRIRSFKTEAVRILNSHLSREGYLVVGLHLKGKTKTAYIHRLVATAFIPNPDGKPQVNHIDGDKTNNRADNLEWATAKRNFQHAFKNGLLLRGGTKQVFFDGSLPNEQWRNIKGFDGYEVSSLGRIRSFRRGHTKLIKSFGGDGYLRVGLVREGKQHHHSIHRLVAEAFVPNPGNKPQVNHINGVINDNRADNLEWCTQSENMRHAVDKGLLKVSSGDKTYNSKVTEDVVKWIREHYIPEDREFGQHALAKKLNVSATTISCIVLGKRYRNADGALSKKCDQRKLTPEQVRYIRQNYIKGDKEFGARPLARKFGVARKTIERIALNEFYKDID